MASVETDFQRIDIFDFAFLNGDKLEYSQSSFPRASRYPLRPDRFVFLDGWIQSTLFHEAAYHEALVHPAMFAHANPKRIAIIGGGEGATLREVLKHDTVKEAIMIEIDEKMVNASREYIPEWSDCSDLEGSASWCIEDPRARVYDEDALAWFTDRYSSSKKPKKSERLDVIIMDAL